MLSVPKPFQLGKRISQVIVVLYIAFTLFLRLVIEEQFLGFWLVSLFVGAICLLVLWAMVKIKILNPGWF